MRKRDRWVLKEGLVGTVVRVIRTGSECDATIVRAGWTWRGEPAALLRLHGVEGHVETHGVLIPRAALWLNGWDRCAGFVELAERRLPLGVE